MYVERHTPPKLRDLVHDSFLLPRKGRRAYGSPRIPRSPPMLLCITFTVSFPLSMFPLTIPSPILIPDHTGGGFSMGSSYFYLEFLFALIELIQSSTSSGRFRNPAVFALEYTLVPDATFPTQLQEAIAGYEHLLTILPDPSRILPVGDSAGATLILSLLLWLARQEAEKGGGSRRPSFAVLISPWVTLVSPRHRDTRSDFINADTLHFYARQYLGAKRSLNQPIVSPGMCNDIDWWQRAAPSRGLAVMYGSEEILADETRELVRMLQHAEVDVVVKEEKGSVHAWPVAALFLSDTGPARLRGLQQIADMIGERLGQS